LKKLIVCGDSYMSPRIKSRNKHFSEIFAKNNNFTLTSYARGGMSNGGIILQLIKAIEEKPDFILLNTTYANRIEFPVEQIDNVSWNDLIYNCNRDEQSSSHQTSKKFASDNLVSLHQKGFLYPDAKIEAIKHYVNELYCEDWKHKTDSMMMYAILHKLHLSQINYIICIDHLFLLKNKFFNLSWIQPKNIVADKFHEFISIPMKEPDPGFHTSFKTQGLMSMFLSEHFNNYFQ